MSIRAETTIRNAAPAGTAAKTGAIARAMRALVKYRALFAMTIPGALYLLINNYLPMFGIVIAFKDINFVKGILGSEWVGFKNFEYLFKTRDAYVILRNTILYNFAFIALGTIAAIGLALLLNEVKNRFFSRVYQSLVLLPFLISMVIVGYLVLAFLNVETGFVNNSILPLFGIEPIAWYNEPKYWPYILTIVKLWNSVGSLCVIYLAAIIGIDREYYEAATLDGAGTWQQVVHITLPLIMPVVIIMTLLAVGRILNADFGLFFQVPLDSGILQPTTNVIDTYVYRALMRLGDIGMSSAAGVFQSVVGFALVMISNAVVRRIDPEKALF